MASPCYLLSASLGDKVDKKEKLYLIWFLLASCRKSARVILYTQHSGLFTRTGHGYPLLARQSSATLL